MEGEEVTPDPGADRVSTPGSPSGPRRRARTTARRPEAVVAAVGAVTSAIHLWWVQTYRHVGSLEVDETGYLAAALRYERNLGDGLPALAARILETITGPLVPLLSTPLVLLGGRSAWVAQAVQPLLHVVAAVAVSGIVHRLAGRRVALVCGVIALTLPAAMLLSRSYQYATSASAFLCLAVWALLASDRGRRRWPMVGFGAAVAAMVLSRTMAVGFVPALAVASLVCIRWNRRSLLNLVAAAGACFLGAGIWWIQGWDGIMGYLQRSGYSEFSGYWGSSRFVGRFGRRWAQLQQDVHGPYLLLGAAALVVTASNLVSARLRRRPWPLRPGAGRELVVLWVTVIGGYAALFSTANTGTWFDLPLVFLAIAGIGGLYGAAPGPVLSDEPGDPAGTPAPNHRPRVGSVAGTVLGTLALGVAAATVAASLSSPTGRSGQRATWWSRVFFAGTDQILTGNFDADERLAAGDADLRRQVADEWADANAQVVAILNSYDVSNGDLVQSVTGSAHLVNINTLLLASELSGTPIASIELPVTFEPEARLRQWLTPYARGTTPRIIVRIRSRSLRFPDDRFPKTYDRLVAELGWEGRERVPLPDGGHVEILVHPESDPLGGS